MANKKKLQSAAIKFRKENQVEHGNCSRLCSLLARFIEKIGVTEAKVGYTSGMYYESAID